MMVSMLADLADVIAIEAAVELLVNPIRCMAEAGLFYHRPSWRDSAAVWPKAKPKSPY